MLIVGDDIAHVELPGGGFILVHMKNGDTYEFFADDYEVLSYHFYSHKDEDEV